WRYSTIHRHASTSRRQPASVPCYTATSRCRISINGVPYPNASTVYVRRVSAYHTIPLRYCYRFSAYYNRLWRQSVRAITYGSTTTPYAVGGLPYGQRALIYYLFPLLLAHIRMASTSSRTSRLLRQLRSM